MASTVAIALSATGGAPEWINILPAGTITTIDGRGPYRIADAARLAAESLHAAGGKMVVDENHSTDLAGPRGESAPARGWIVALEARADGIWGQVEWNASGKQLLAENAYRGISPAFLHSKDGQVLQILRVSLTNTPNLRGMTALHQESTMTIEDLLAALRKELGLADTADAAAVIASVKSKIAPTAMQAALQSALAPIAKAAGLKDDADADAVIGAVTTLAAGARSAPGAEAVIALQSELKTVTTELNTLKTGRAADVATAFVDGAIKSGRVGVKPLRDHYIAQHAVDPARVEKEINAMPVLGPSGTHIAPPAPDKDGKVALNAEQMTAAKILGIDPVEYAKTLAAENAAAA